MNPTQLFQLGQQFGENSQNSRTKQKDISAIDEILSKANSTGNPQDVEMAMTQILSRVSPERQPMALNILQRKQQQLLAKQEQDKQQALLDQERTRKRNAYSNLGLEGLEDLSPQLQKSIYDQRANDSRFQNVLGNNQPAPEQAPAMQPSNQESPQQKKGMASLSDDQLIALSGVKGYSEPAKQELKRRQEERSLDQKKEEGKIKRHTDISQKTLDKAETIAEQIPQKRSALGLMNNAIANKDMSFWSWDNLAEATGIEGLRSPEGALFKTAGKEYFLGNLSRAGARPNQWIEQQISDMLTKIGRSTEANLTVTRALENELDLDEERVRLTQTISDGLEKKLGYVPRDLGNRVNTELKKYADRRQKELYNDLRAIKSIGENKSQVFGKVEEGTPVSKVVAKALLKQFNNDPKKAAEEAKKLGYSF